MDFFVVKLLIVLLTLFFFAFLVFDVKHKRVAIFTLSVLLLSTFVSAMIGTNTVRGRDDVLYSPSPSGDTVLLQSDNETTVIYSGRAVSKGARDILNSITDTQLTYVDNFVFTSYSHSTIEFARIIIDGVKVEKIMLPRPTTEEELGQAEGLSYLLADYGTYLEFYKPRTYIDIGDYQYCLFSKDDYTYGDSPENVFEVVIGNSSIVYVSACEYTNLPPSAKSILMNAENLIIGTKTDSKTDNFDMVLPKIKNVYYSTEGVISDSAKNYYNKKGASTSYVKTPLSFID
jgi:hypothetical protein